MVLWCWLAWFSSQNEQVQAKNIMALPVVVFFQLNGWVVGVSS